VRYPRPGVLVGGSQHSEDLHQLVQHVGAGKQRSSSVRQLGQNASSRPHVYAGCVKLGSKQDIRWAVPQGHHLCGVALYGNAEGPSQTKVSQLQFAILVDQQVLRLQIAMQDVVARILTLSC